jgi:hypothetical protein
LANGVDQIVAIAVRLMSLLLKIQSNEFSIAVVRAEVLDAKLSKRSIVAMNGVLSDPPTSILGKNIMPEILSHAVNAAQDTDVHFFPGVLTIELDLGTRHTGHRKNNENRQDRKE